MSSLRLGRLVTYFEDDEPWYSWWDDDGKVGLLLSPFVIHVVGLVGETMSRSGCSEARALVSLGSFGTWSPFLRTMDRGFRGMMEGELGKVRRR
jgi:hypothetical protein